jgi:hypothetical protein
MVLRAKFALCPAGRFSGGEKVKIVELAGVTGPETDCVPPTVAVKVSDENSMGLLTPMFTDEIISVSELLLVIAKVPPATVEPGLPLPFPGVITLTTGVGIAVGVGATVGIAVEVGAPVGVAVEVGAPVGVGVLVTDDVGVDVGVDEGFGNDGPKAMDFGWLFRATTLPGVGTPLALGKGCENCIMLPGRDQTFGPPLNALLRALPPFPYQRFLFKSKVAVNGQSMEAITLAPI